jgi:hypothetical protein
VIEDGGRNCLDTVLRRDSRDRETEGEGEELVGWVDKGAALWTFAGGTGGLRSRLPTVV